jgi:hypothetical protein
VFLVEVLKDVGLQLRELLLDTRMHHFLGLLDGLAHVGVPIVHALQDFGLRGGALTRLALSCSSCAMAA